MDDADTQFSRGSWLAGVGRHLEALEAYDLALTLRPGYVEVLNNRGLALARLGRHSDAMADYDAALALRPQYARAWNNRGLALASLRRHTDAVESFLRALDLQPDYLPALVNIADSLAALGCKPEALGHLERALKMEGSRALGYRLGLSLAALGEHERALASFEHAARENPQDPQVWISRASSLLALGRAEPALESAARAVMLDPSLAEGFERRALASQQLERHAEALEAWERFIELRPNSAEAFCNRGACLRKLARVDEAMQSLDRSVDLDPALAEAYYNRAVLLDQLGEPGRALEDCGRALAVRPRYLLALYLQGMIQLRVDRPADARRTLQLAVSCAESTAEAPVGAAELRAAELFACAATCQWERYADQVPELEAAVDRGDYVPPFLFTCFSNDASRSRRCAEIAAARLGLSGDPRARARLDEPYRHQRIRVAYLCGEFRDHPVGRLVAALIEHHDRAAFEIIGVSLGPSPPEDPVTARLKGLCDRFIDARLLTPDAIARDLREREIDIAVDLNGYTGELRPGILARRPAPVQVSYLAYPGTTASAHIDYLLADPIVIPPDARRHYSEQVVYLPDCFMVTDNRPARDESKPDRASLGLPEDALVLCAFHNAYKITPEMFAAWVRLMRSVPDSVLWLRLRDSHAHGRLREEAAKSGISPERLVLAGPAPGGAHLARLRQADLFLDTAPYCAHSTAADVLQAGVPIVTLIGDTFAGRVSASALTAACLSELVTTSIEDYEALAGHLMGHPAELRALRQRIAHTVPASALFDSGRTCRHIEQAYRVMQDLQRAGGRPRAFSV